MASKVPIQVQISSVGFARELLLKCDLIPKEQIEVFRENIQAAMETLDYLDQNAAEIREALIALRKAKNDEKREGRND